MLYSGNRISFLFFVLDSKMKEIEHSPIHLVSVSYSCQFFSFVPCISTWCGLLLRCWMLMYCRSWGSTWNMSYVVLFLWLGLYVVVCITVVWLWVCWLIHATFSLSFFCRSWDPVENSRWAVLIMNSYAWFCVPLLHKGRM